MHLRVYDSQFRFGRLVNGIAGSSVRIVSKFYYYCLETRLL